MGHEPDTGKKIPIDPKPIIYRVYEMKNGIEAVPEVIDGEDILGVNHFTTCPTASEFHGGRN